MATFVDPRGMRKTEWFRSALEINPSRPEESTVCARKINLDVKKDNDVPRHLAFTRQGTHKEIARTKRREVRSSGHRSASVHSRDARRV